MSIDPDELAKYNAALSHTPTDVIQKRLDDDVIARQWKRDLAEKEIARRGGGGGKALPVLDKLKLHRAAEIKGWLITVVLVLGALAIAAAIVLGKMPR